MELLGDIISWLCPALPRHIIQTPWSISCEEGRWDPKMIVVFCFISWRWLPPKGPWFVWNDVKRKPVEDFSVVGKEANLRHRVFCGCFFFFWIGSTWFASLFTRSGNTFLPLLVFIAWWESFKLAHKSHALTFNKFKMKQRRKHIFSVFETNLVQGVQQSNTTQTRKGTKMKSCFPGSLGTSNHAAVVRGASELVVFLGTGNHQNHETSHLEEVIFQARFGYVTPGSSYVKYPAFAGLVSWGGEFL